VAIARNPVAVEVHRAVDDGARDPHRLGFVVVGPEDLKNVGRGSFQ
jgi:hypothetical protein